MTTTTVLSQMMAAPAHDSPEGLRKIFALIPKVFILTGDTDMLVDPSGGHFSYTRGRIPPF